MPSELHEERLDVVTSLIVASGATRVLDLGCGPGDLLRRLARRETLHRVVGTDPDPGVVARARAALDADASTRAATPRLEVRHGRLEEAGDDLVGFDAAALVEILEHIDPERLPEVERAVFVRLRPGLVVVTTPNREYNVLHGMEPGALRHPDHRFEWDRARFRRWAAGVGQRSGYRVRFDGIGPEDPELGTSTQVAVFQRVDREGRRGGERKGGETSAPRGFRDA